VVAEPDTRYARTGDGAAIAFQTLGQGRPDLLCVGHNNLVSIDLRDDEPHFRRFEHRLASFSRYIRFDPRGLGLSDPFLPDTPWTVERGVDDVITVLDAIDSSEAALFAVGASAPTALQVAATHPERVSSLVLVNGYARLASADDYPAGFSPNLLDQFGSSVLDDPGDRSRPMDDIDLFVPSLRGDPDFRAWWKRAGQRSASPASARQRMAMTFSTDVRAVLPAVTAPTLLLHRIDSLLSVRLSRYLADHIAGSRLIELPGDDHEAYAGDADAIVDEIEEFVTGVRGGSGTDRILTTILFTDIVNSTEHAIRRGDRLWHELLDRHENQVRHELRRFGGREVKTTGDGVLATFDAPSRGIRCALAVCTAARHLGIEVRAGLHSGEVEVRGDDVSGIAVHIAQRVSALASADEVLVSRTVADLVAGSSLRFEDRGEHRLKGVDRPWLVLAVTG
jgi:class 3 adenylate cyclase